MNEAPGEARELSERMTEPLRAQYATDANLRARMLLHKDFSTNPEGWLPWLARQLDVTRCDRVLEVGCGPAWLWSAVEVPTQGRLVLSDSSTGMLASACETLKRTAQAADLVAADVRQLPFADAAFDLAIANHMLYHVPDPAEALAELARVLVPGGRLVAATNGRRALLEIDAIAAGHFATARPASRLTERFGLETGPALVARYFVDVDVIRYPDSLEITQAEPLVAYIASLQGVQERSSAAQFEGLRRDVEAQIARNGSVLVTKDSGIIVGRRPPAR